MGGKEKGGRILYVLIGVLLLCTLAAVAFWATSRGEVPEKDQQEAPGTTAQEVLGEAQSAQDPPEEEAQTLSGFGETLAQLLAQIAQQEETDRMILAELESGAYTFEEPLVIVDPYHCSPLTALLLFETEAPARVSVRVLGRTQDADIAFDFETLNTRHLIPVYGLYEDAQTEVSLSLYRQDGSGDETQVSITAEKLPLGRDQLIFQTYSPGAGKMQEGLNFTYVHKQAFDLHGDIRWSIADWGNQQATRYGYQDGTYVTAYGHTMQGDTLFFERNMLGKFLRVYYSPYGVHHDIEEAAQGNLLITGSNDTGTVEDFLYEIDRETGAITNTLDLKRVLPRTSVRSEESTMDWLHNNAIVWVDGDIIISNRHNSSVVRMSWPDGGIRWMIASADGWSPIYQQHLLQPVGEGEFEWPNYQHAPEILPDLDGDPDTMDLLLYDNGTYRFAQPELQRQIRANEITQPESYSRMVHYRINEREKTIEQIWEYGKERGEEWYSIRCGNANLLQNGNRLAFSFRDENVSDGTISNQGILTEVNAQKELVCEAIITTPDGNYTEYRAERMSLYHASDEDLCIGSATVNLIPEGTLHANGVIQ